MGKDLDNGRVRSLRWRLLALVSVATLLGLAAAASLSYRQARHEVEELMDGQLAKTAQLMLAQAQQDPDFLARLPGLVAEQRGLRARRGQLTLEYQVGRPDGTILVRSANAPTSGFDAPLGFLNVSHANHPWRSLVLDTTDGQYRIQVAQSIPGRDREALEIARKTVLPLGIILPLLLVAIYFSVRIGLRPLNRLADEVLSRSPENLSPLVGRPMLREVQPLVAALNRLFFRVSGSLENERRFTADAAHELRTPLAAARIQAQVAMLSEQPEARQHALTQTLAGLDRATRLVEQMLRLARLDPLAQLSNPAPVNLAELLNDVIAGIRDTEPERSIELQIDTTSQTIIDGDAGLLEVALRNLLGNALRYSPPEHPVTVFLRHEPSELVMGVSDSGPGVPHENLTRLTERFFRGTEAKGDGSGLGLTIVHRIAELHGARLALQNRESGGFEASLCWRRER